MAVPQFEISVFESEEPLAKKFWLEPDGSLERGGGGKLVRGFVRREAFTYMSGFAEFLQKLNGTHALAYGLPKHKTARVLADGITEKGGDDPVITRTRKEFSWPKGEGIFLYDYDPPKAGEAPQMKRDEVYKALLEACPGLKDAPTILWHSASSYIYHGEKQLRGEGGYRIYIRVKDASDIARMGEVLFKRLWLAGRGWIRITKNGSLVERAAVDASVWTPERLDFAGGASCAPPLEQRRPAPVVLNDDFDSEAVDTRIAVPDLTEEEEAQYKALVAAARSQKKPQADEIRKQWLEDYLAPLSEEKREEIRKALETNVLLPDFPLILSEDDSVVTVREVLANKEFYHKKFVRHPLEPEHQKDNPKVAQINTDGEPNVFTFARGRQTFFLKALTPEEVFADVRPEGPVRASTLPLMDTPPREWLLGKRYVSKFITATVAPGGGSKSTLVMQEAVSVASGKSICGEEIKVVGPVWIANGEDPLDEVQRRLAAICMHHKLDPVEDTKNIFLSGKEFEMKMAVPGEKGQFTAIQATIDRIEIFIRDNGIKMWVLDPFVSCHGFPEGDNTNLNFVMKIISGICDRTSSSCSVVAHSPKNVDVSGNADAWRGAGATRDAARIMDTVAVMDDKECDKYGISKTMRTWYIKRESAKANMRPPGEDLKWFKRISVLLPNGKDHIGVLEPTELDTVETIPAEDSFISQVVFSMMNDGDVRTAQSIAETIIKERGEELGALMGGVPSAGTLREKIITLFTTPQIDEDDIEIRYVNKKMNTSKATKFLTAKLRENDAC